MIFSTLLAFYLFFITEQATAMALGPERRGLQVCFANEAKTLFCYKKPQGTPQDIKVADMVYAAKALREYGTGTQMKLDTDGNPVLDENGIPIEVPLYRFLNMTTSTASECGEWTIFSDAETVLVTAKLMTKKTNGLVVSFFRVATASRGKNADAFRSGSVTSPALLTAAREQRPTNRRKPS